MNTYIKKCKWGKFILIRGDMICNHVDMYGEWSETEVDLFRSLVPENGNCIEVGSNIGMHAVPLSIICKNGSVFCYEPQRPIYHVLCGNLAINCRLNVIARNVAVGAQPGHIEIDTSDYEEPWNYGAFSIAQGFNAEGQYRSNTHKITIDMITLDDDPALTNLENISLIKIDAEGFEANVLLGARKLIERHQPNVFIEANSEPTVRKVLAEMHAIDYVGYWFINNRFRANNYNRLPYRMNGYDQNIIFLPRGRPLPGTPLMPVMDFGDIGRGVPILDSYR
ncbi:FkbM family methyltransferase [Pseudomonas sp. NPDC087346]|uniref:FkbM family methyltransferase n=1 Tax=Pseudomonas sp. NPDC087346 TaxID=3364438 RepID=UPI00381D357D